MKNRHLYIKIVILVCMERSSLIGSLLRKVCISMWKLENPTRYPHHTPRLGIWETRTCNWLVWGVVWRRLRVPSIFSRILLLLLLLVTAAASWTAPPPCPPLLALLVYHAAATRHHQMISTTHPTIFLLSPELCPLLPVELGAAGVSAAHVGGVAVTVGGAVREAGHAHTRHVVIHLAQPGHHHHHNIHHAQPGHGASGSAETRCSNKWFPIGKKFAEMGLKGRKMGENGHEMINDGGPLHCIGHDVECCWKDDI